VTSTATATNTATITLTPTITPTPLPPTGEGSLIPIGNIPAQYAGRTLEIGLFGPGNVVNCQNQGSAWLAVVNPEGTPVSFTWYAEADAGTNRTGDPDLTSSSPFLTSGDHNPNDMSLMAQATSTVLPGGTRPQLLQPLYNPTPPTGSPANISSTAQGSSTTIGFEENPVPAGFSNVPGIMVANDGQYFFDGSWLYIDVQIPTQVNGQAYPGGYWKLEYVPVPRPIPNGGILAADRLTMTLKISGAPVYLVQ
jgi:hypothetical protein